MAAASMIGLRRDRSTQTPALALVRAAGAPGMRAARTRGPTGMHATRIGGPTGVSRSRGVHRRLRGRRR